MAAVSRSIRASLTAVAAITVCAALPAEAEPFVGSVRTGTAPVRIAGTDGRIYEITSTFVSAHPASGSVQQTLKVTLKSCNAVGECGKPVTYAVPLKSATIADDLSSASAQATFGGTPIEIRWSSNAADPADIGLNTEVSSNGVATKEPGGGAAGVVVSVVGLRCTGSGSLVSMRAVYADYANKASGPAAPPKAPVGLRRAGSRAPKCMRAGS